MSIKLTAKAWETNQSGNDLLVLLALCEGKIKIYELNRIED